MPSRPPQTTSLSEAQGFATQGPQGEVDRLALGGQTVPFHDHAARLIVQIDVGAGHTPTIHLWGGGRGRLPQGVVVVVEQSPRRQGFVVVVAEGRLLDGAVGVEPAGAGVVMSGVAGPGWASGGGMEPSVPAT